jgi:hypothetical protein
VSPSGFSRAISGLTVADTCCNILHRFNDRKPAVGVYAEILEPPVSICDVTYWLNYLLEKDEKFKHSQLKYSAINTAGELHCKLKEMLCKYRYISNGTIYLEVEATTLNERSYRLRPQDKFIRDKISSQDVLIVSIGGNDIALAPTPCTICSVAGLLCLPTGCLENGRSFGAVPVSYFRFASSIPFDNSYLVTRLVK